MKKEFTVKNMHPSFIENFQNYDDFVVVYNHDISEINDGVHSKDEKNTDRLDGLVKITGNRKPIYRRLRPYSPAGAKSGEVQMHFHTQNLLGVKENDTVTIEPTCAFKYMWNNPDVSVRAAYRTAIWAFVFSCILATTLGILSFIF